MFLGFNQNHISMMIDIYQLKNILCFRKNHITTVFHDQSLENLN